MTINNYPHAPYLTLFIMSFISLTEGIYSAHGNFSDGEQSSALFDLFVAGLGFIGLIILAKMPDLIEKNKLAPNLKKLTVSLPLIVVSDVLGIAAIILKIMSDKYASHTLSVVAASAIVCAILIALYALPAMEILLFLKSSAHQNTHNEDTCTRSTLTSSAAMQA